VDRHLPHDTARNARFFVGIVNAAKMEIFSAGQQPAPNQARYSRYWRPSSPSAASRAMSRL
jgi:hypothetical protein